MLLTCCHVAQEHVLSRAGDFVQWDKGVVHKWVAEEPCVMFTVRWPSLSA
jgi:hypothetical protein